MPSLNFNKEFAPGILAMLDKNYAKRTGVKPKCTTIRAKRKRPIRKGDQLYLYSGLKTKYCQKLGEVACRKTEAISIRESAATFYEVIVNDVQLSNDEIQKLAQADGFASGLEMVNWFKKAYGLPFEDGQRIHMANTYDRKYFCNKKVKDHGFTLQLETTQKTINVHQEDVEAAKADRYIAELATKHNYGVQIINPLFR
ncbi:MAG TPA: hypothetical protein VFC67_08850 [Prolixibacteraceae bacterium]|nr:hypothetical protein [Prolixibacteraceae bacterium]